MKFLTCVAVLLVAACHPAPMPAKDCRWSGWQLVSPDSISYCTPAFRVTTVWRKKTEGGWLYMTGYSGKGHIEFVPGGGPGPKKDPPQDWTSDLLPGASP